MENLPAEPMEGPMLNNMGMNPEVPEDNMMDDEASMPDENEGDDSTMSIINQLSDEDKESVRAYAESMLDKSEDNDENPEMDGETAPAVPEGKTFTKKQLKEAFGVKPEDDMENNFGPSKQPKKKTISKNSPFNPPMFN